MPAGSRKEEGSSQPRMTELTRDAAGRKARRASGPGTAEEEGVMMTLGVEQLPGVMRLLRWLSAGWMEIMGWPIMVAPAPLLPVRLMTCLLYTSDAADD